MSGRYRPLGASAISTARSFPVIGAISDYKKFRTKTTEQVGQVRGGQERERERTGDGEGDDMRRRGQGRDRTWQNQEWRG